VTAWIDRLLSVPVLVEDLVREVDMEWGRMYQERPVFEREGQEAAENDPYTVAGVRRVLEGLRERG
jgi:hypothetical protein